MAGSSGNSTGPPAQTGVLGGANPVAYNSSSPITLFIIQACIVIIFCQLLHYPLRLINQPRVIAEVIGGIILGPSVMMRIPGFKDAIFPTESMPVFNNVANLGLIIFLFLVALEVDIRLFKANWKIALSVGFAGMILPFGLGCAIAWGLYHQFRTDAGIVEIGFGIYALFIGTAMAITAFPVLCRILTELKLLRSNAGVTVLAAGIGNDVTGWILLALCVALVNNGSGLAALWCLLCGVGWTLFLFFAVRPCFIWILRRTGSLQNGPTQGMVALTMLMTLTSAWFTGIVGIHPIFGAFLVGLICPHDGGFAIKMTEKIEDLISVLFLPLYFALSGLSTNLGLLNDGITWGYVIGIIVIAFAGKIIGGTIAAKLCGMFWRESATVGVLMSCKGLVELIVLNIGLQAKILSPRTFTMFVVMALVTTVATTPLTKLLYPLWYRQKVEKFRRGEINWDGTPTESSAATSQIDSIEKLQASQIRRLLVYLRLDSLPSLFTFIALLGADPSTAALTAPEETSEPARPHIKRRPLEVHGLRLVELTERTSSVMQVTEGHEYHSAHDPVVNAFRTFSQLNDVAASGRVSVVPLASYSETLMTQAADVASDFALIPWSEYGSITEDQSLAPYFAVNAGERFRAGTHLDFVQKTLAKAARTCNSGVFINNGFGGVSASAPALQRRRSAISIRSMGDGGAAAEPALLPVTDKSHHVFFPFFGGADDRVALRFVLQLAKNAVVTATITHFSFPGTGEGEGEESDHEIQGTSRVTVQSAIADKNRVVEDEVSASDLALLHTLQSSLPEEVRGRVTFTEVSVSSRAVVEETVAAAAAAVGKSPKNAGDLVVVGRRHRRLGDVDGLSGADFKQTVGVVAERLAMKGVKASLLVIQAGGLGMDL